MLDVSLVVGPVRECPRLVVGYLHHAPVNAKDAAAVNEVALRQVLK